MAIEEILTEHGKKLRGLEKDLKKIKEDLNELKSQKKIDKKQLLDLEKRVGKLELKIV